MLLYLTPDLRISAHRFYGEADNKATFRLNTEHAQPDKVDGQCWSPPTLTILQNQLLKMCREICTNNKGSWEVVAQFACVDGADRGHLYKDTRTGKPTEFSFRILYQRRWWQFQGEVCLQIGEKDLDDRWSWSTWNFIASPPHTRIPIPASESQEGRPNERMLSKAPPNPPILNPEFTKRIHPKDWLIEVALWLLALVYRGFLDRGGNPGPNFRPLLNESDAIKSGTEEPS